MCVAERCTSPTYIDPSTLLPQLFIAAHTDDLLFFMNPDVEASLRSGQPSWTVVVSSGDVDGSSNQTRYIEAQTLVVFAMMAGRAGSDWTCASGMYAGKPATSCTHSTQASLKVTFLRLRSSHPPDATQVPNLWGYDVGSIYPFTPISEVQQVIEDGAAYSRADLIGVLTEIIDESQARVIGIPDPTWTYGGDDIDSTGVARFAIEASHRAATFHVLRAYRGYNIFIDWDATESEPEVPNLTRAEHDEKARLLNAYDEIDASTNTAWDGWCWRRYTVDEVGAGTGALQVPAGCLEPPVTSEGSPRIAACDANSPMWTLGPDHAVEAPGGGCLAVADDRSVVVTACAATPAQRWTLMDNGQLHGLDGGCLTLGADGVISAELCGSDRSAPHFTVPVAQRWTLGSAAPVPLTASGR